MFTRLIVFCAYAGLAFAQPAFDVASIKAIVPPGLSAPPRITPGAYAAMGMSLDYLIRWAYGIRDSQLTGQPAWMKSGRFEVQAKAPGTADESQMKLMMQALLAERCHLQFHRGTKEFSGYALTMAKVGPKLQEAKGDVERGNIQIGAGYMWGRGASMPTLAETLSVIVERPVFDKTGLDGKYDFKLEYDPSSVRVGNASPGDAAAPSPGASGSVFSALQEQIGLRLDSFKGPLEILVIDHIDPPSEN